MEKVLYEVVTVSGEVQGVLASDLQIDHGVLCFYVDGKFSIAYGVGQWVSAYTMED